MTSPGAGAEVLRAVPEGPESLDARAAPGASETSDVWRDGGPAGWVERDFPVDQELSRAFLARPQAERVGPPIRFAATVELVRDGADGLEVFVMRRHARMAFAAEMVVFPGGRIDEADADPLLPIRGALPTAAFGVDADRARAIVAAAVREVVEETGVWLTVDTDGRPDAPPVATTEAMRGPLERGELSLLDALTRLGLAIDADLLAPQGNWVTPTSESMRYDTAFLVAAMPPGQQVLGVCGEADHSGWARPQVLLDAFAAGTIQLLPPTQVTLEQLAALPDVASALAGPHVIAPIVPALVDRGDEVVLTARVPATPAYPGPAPATTAQFGPTHDVPAQPSPARAALAEPSPARATLGHHAAATSVAASGRPESAPETGEIP